MQRFVKMSLVLGLMLTITGCGSGNNPSAPQPTEAAPSEEATAETVEEVKEPLDLTGKWVQEDHDSDTYMVAEIRQDKIGVFFMLEGDDEPWTYWVGTYKAPEDDSETYKWVSENTYAGSGMLAATSDTKEFTYESGKLSYPITINGDSGTIHMIREDWETSADLEPAFGSMKAENSDLTALEIVDSGWILSDSKYLYYYVDLYNPSEKTAVEFPSFRITAKDANGVLLGTEDQTLSIIYPGQHFVYGFQAFSVDENPATVDFEPLDVEEHNLKDASVLGDYVPLEVINTAVRSDKLVGEIHNAGDKDYDNVVVTAIVKNQDGKLVDVITSFVDNVKAGSDTAYSASHNGIDETSTVEFHAYEW